MPMIIVEQIRGARAMLGMKQGDLARKAGISVSTLNNIERGVQTDPKISTLRAIQHALEQDGIEFSESETGNKVGIFLHTKAQGLPRQTVLIIDDSESDRALYKGWLTRRKGFNYEVLEADNARDGYDLLAKHKPCCIILDYMIYGMNGLQMLCEMEGKEKIEMPPIIFLTSSSNAGGAQQGNAEQHFVNKKDLSREMLYSLMDDCTRHARVAA